MEMDMYSVSIDSNLKEDLPNTYGIDWKFSGLEYCYLVDEVL